MLNAMSEVKNVLFIINKASGTGYSSEIDRKIVNACAKNNIECSLQFTNGRGHATALAKEGTIKNYDRVIAVGGDGTVNEVAQGLLHTSTPMGIIPKGSGNGLARHLGISMKIHTALIQVLNGTVLTMDTFSMNGCLSLNVSGIGFDGHIANLFNAGKKRGFWSYTKLVVREFMRYPQFNATVHLTAQNGQTSSVTNQSFMIAIANASQYGNNAWVVPVASIMDQTLQLALIKKVPAQRGFHFGYQMFTGKLETGKDYECLSLQKGIIQTPAPVAFHIDGEPCGHANSFSFEIIPHSLRIVVPTHRKRKI